MRFPIWLLVGVLVGLGFGSAVWILGKAKSTELPAETIGITVFIHGTVGSTLNILNPSVCLNDSICDKETFVRRFLRSYRNNEAMEADQVFGREGLHEFVVSSVPKPVCADGCMKASDYIIPAYHEIAQAVGVTKTHNRYFVYGWTGLLSQRARKETAEDLYLALIGLKNRLVAEYEQKGAAKPLVKITLVTHSHGGNVGKLLAAAEKKYQKDLLIDWLVMYGTPMQKETAAYIASPVFKNIVLFHSKGDSIQTRDYFSTTAHSSYARMSDVFDTDSLVMRHGNMRRHDVQLLVNNNETKVTHTNMWMLGRSYSICRPYMKDLPMMVLTPLFIAALERSSRTCTHYKFNYAMDAESCWLGTISCVKDTNKPVRRNQKIKVCAEKICRIAERPIHDIITRWDDQIHDYLKQAGEFRHVVFNKKNWRIIKDIVMQR